MKYYFKLSEASERRDAILAGREPERITLYEETPSIIEDFQNNELSDWGPVEKVGSSSKNEFSSEQEAEKEYYCQEGIDIYCILHDC